MSSGATDQIYLVYATDTDLLRASAEKAVEVVLASGAREVGRADYEDVTVIFFDWPRVNP